MFISTRSQIWLRSTKRFAFTALLLAGLAGSVLAQDKSAEDLYRDGELEEVRTRVENEVRGTVAILENRILIQERVEMPEIRIVSGKRKPGDGNPLLNQKPRRQQRVQSSRH